MLHDYYNENGVRKTCHDVKNDASMMSHILATCRMASDFVKTMPIRQGDIIVPAPQHTGHATYTKEIADMVAEATGAVVWDVLRCTPRPSLYERKLAGEKPSVDIFLSKDIPLIRKGKTVYFLDNVISTGATFKASVKAFGHRMIPMVYATDNSYYRKASLWHIS